MGRRRPDRHRYGPKGEYRGGSSDDSPLTRLLYKALGLAVIGAVGLYAFGGCR